MAKYVYFFGDGKAEGNKEMRNLLGGKGCNIAEMTNIGIPVPAGFTISTEACVYFFENGGKHPRGLEEEVENNLRKLEKVMGRRFGDKKNPLLVSVRSGARVSMPGMMDTVLNLGLNDETIEGIAEQMGDERPAYDSYRRLVHMFGDVVMGLKPEKEEQDPFVEILDNLKKERNVEYDVDLKAEDLKELVEQYKQLIKDRLGEEFPQDPRKQLWLAIDSVFKSWNTPRAIAYRELEGIPDDWGTAVNVQSMVFGNLGNDSGTGVMFTRDPATGENKMYGEYLINAQGEDVVAGIRTPKAIDELKSDMPDIYDQLNKIRLKLEKHYKEMQDVEFTIEKGKLWILQTRAGKRTGLASIKIAVDMVEEGLISKEDAILRLDPIQLNQLLRPIFDSDQKAQAVREGKVVAKGLNAGPGAASGQVVFFAEDATDWAKDGKQVILVRLETSPDDIRGMSASQGVLTSRGGMTSHAALVARQMGKVCIVGCGDLIIDYQKRQIEVNNTVIKEGDWISIDGSTGEVILGKLETRPSEVLQVLLDKTMKPEESEAYRLYSNVMTWADEFRRLGVRTNADEPEQSWNALQFGAEGIGLCRTEHMFFEGDRILSVQKMIIAETDEERREAIFELLPMQREDFIGIFRVMEGRPVTIRTLDPPLHEFLPHNREEIDELAKKINVSAEKIEDRVQALSEANPMLGHRGCRLGITYPEITEMQARAIFEAACTVKKEGIDVHPEVMIPLVGHVKELELQAEVVNRVAKDVFKEQGIDVQYLVGTMIEIPRAAITADEVAKVAEFFSFGTNDLTQTCLGVSRDDAGRFLPLYVNLRIYDRDPFSTIDFDGVGKLVDMGTKLGRKTRPDLKVGICGEHGGDPESVKFCHRVGLDYVSCSPFRVPIARLAAAQESILEKRSKK
ncbi:MAG: pyruvate, phosphate dikinase [Candidatus Coatesbacteria bacterium]|nr:MAG: pyruvate, phosphate dikinase [Candidatus Coatesbacteria bacterium]RLC44521.1 MAG: pyruvate, phosphate dikinase [Candidatus Coatesbacteria bacterium]